MLDGILSCQSPQWIQNEKFFRQLNRIFGTVTLLQQLVKRKQSVCKQSKIQSAQEHINQRRDEENQYFIKLQHFSALKWKIDHQARVFTLSICHNSNNNYKEKDEDEGHSIKIHSAHYEFRYCKSYFFCNNRNLQHQVIITFNCYL